MPEALHQTRLERILGVPLTEDAVRQWPQSGEVIRGRERIAEVESHFVGLRLGVGRRHAAATPVLVEWSTDYGDGRVYRNVSIAELQEGKAVRVTDYWREPFAPPAWLADARRAARDAAQRNLASNRRPDAGLTRHASRDAGNRPPASDR